MKTCSGYRHTKHEQIVYQNENLKQECPLCKALVETAKVEEEVMALRSEIVRLERGKLDEKNR